MHDKLHVVSSQSCIRSSPRVICDVYILGLGSRVAPAFSDFILELVHSDEAYLKPLGVLEASVHQER